LDITIAREAGGYGLPNRGGLADRYGLADTCRLAAAFLEEPSEKARLGGGAEGRGDRDEKKKRHPLGSKHVENSRLVKTSPARVTRCNPPGKERF
jgi:hypothetical protein